MTRLTLGEGPKVTPDLTPVLEAQIATLRAVSELLRAQLRYTREECDRLRQKAERLALPPPAPPVPLPPRRRRRRRWWQPAWEACSRTGMLAKRRRGGRSG